MKWKWGKSCLSILLSAAMVITGVNPVLADNEDGTSDTAWVMEQDQDYQNGSGIFGDAVTIENVKSGYMLGPTGGLTSNGTELFQWSYGGESDQHWTLEPNTCDGVGTIKLMNQKSNRSAAVYGGSLNGDATIILWDYSGGKDQNWILEKAGDYYRFKNANSGLYLTMNGEQTAAVAVQKALDEESQLQLWKIKLVNEPEVTEPTATETPTATPTQEADKDKEDNGEVDEDATQVSWVMSQEGNYFQDMGTLTTTQWDESNHESLYIDVDENITYQELAENVWGGCFNERGWDKLMQLSQEDRDHVLDLLFDPDEPEGLHLTMARMPIGSSDYAMDMYSLDETEDDYDLSDFSIDRDKEKLIPYIKAALERQPNLKIWASPWSPPWWMKKNSDGSARTEKNGGYIDDTEENLTTYANYFLKFIQAYKEEGINISMVSPQNEPTMNTAYSSCVWTGEQLRDFIKNNLGPTLEGTGVEIYLGTFTDSDDSRVAPTLSDPDAKKYISGITFQWWSYNEARSLYNTGFDLDMMQSETMCGDGWNNWTYAENQFDEMYMYFSNGITSYNLWNMVLEWDGVSAGGNNTAENPWHQNAPITVNESTDQYTLNPQYYETLHFTKYVKSGARRISSEGTYDTAYTPTMSSDSESDSVYTAKLREIAFRNTDGTIALLVKNSDSSSKKVDINFNGRKISVTIPAHSINTFTTQGTPLTGEETDMTDKLSQDEIVTLENVSSGKVLSVNGGGTASLSQIIQWNYSGQANQQWYLEPSSVNGVDTVKLVNIKSFSIAAVDGGGTSDGKGIILWPYTGGADQNWILEEAGDYYKLKNANSGLYLTMTSTSKGNQAVQKAESDSKLQLWNIQTVTESAAATPTPTPEATPIPKTLADFDFDEAPVDGTYTGGNAIATVQGEGVQQVEGLEGNKKAIKLNGTSNSWLTVTDQAGNFLLKGVEELTISYDSNTSAEGSEYAGWAFYAAPDEDTQTYNYEKYLGIMDLGGNINVERYNNSGSRSDKITGSALTEWKHVDIVFAKDSTILYINGVKQDEKSSTVDLKTLLGDDGVFYIGKANWTSSGEYFAGLIDNFKVYSYAKTEEEVQATVETVTTTYVAGEGGKITGTAKQVSVKGANTTSVTAVANKNYKFVGWDDGTVTAKRSDVANEDKTYTAIFAEDLTSDLNSINTLIADAKSKAESGDYTDASVAVLKPVIEEVEKAAVAASTRAELNELKTKLQAAIDQLEVKSAVPEVEAPAQVTGVKATATTSAVTLKWDAVEGAQGYEVLEWKPAQKKYVAIGITDKLTYAVKSKKAGNAYRYKVRGYKVSDSGNVYGKYSKIAKVITKPKKVTVKSATKKSNTTVTLKFTNSPKATSYIIYEQNAKTKKYQIAYKIEGKKLYKYVAKTKKYKVIGKASLSKTRIWTAKLTGLDLKKADKNAKFMVKAVRSAKGFKDAVSAASNGKTLK